ncbi:MAG: hypothetical protein SynsKO_45420 [Synoicihabitans sp.]
MKARLLDFPRLLLVSTLFGSFSLQADVVDLDAVDRFGGLKAIKADATGFFRTEKIGDRWMFITPDGHGYLPLGANHIGRYLDEQAEDMGLMDRVGGDRSKALHLLINEMKAMGLNSGEAYAPIDPEIKSILPWVLNIDYPQRTKFAYDVFDPAFQAELRETYLAQCQVIADDPMVLGIACADLPVWDERRLQFFESLPTDAPGAKVLARFRAEGKSDNAFLGHVADVLYGQMRKIAKEGAPNHLFFGERFRLRGAPDEVIAAVGRHVDVFCTQALILSPHRPPEWQLFQQLGYDHEHGLTGGKPMLIIDWAAPFALAGDFQHERGLIKNEQTASEEAARFIAQAMARPYMVGIFKCQLIGLHGADRQFEGKSQRTYLQNSGFRWNHRTTIVGDAHREALTRAYAEVLTSN